jgi:hypothetical protein
MKLSLRIATLLMGVSIASTTGLFGMALLALSQFAQLQNSSAYEGNNSYGSSVIDQAKHEISVYSKNLFSRTQGLLRPDTLLWFGVGMLGMSLASMVYLLFSAFLDDVWRIGAERKGL